MEAGRASHKICNILWKRMQIVSGEATSISTPPSKLRVVCSGMRVEMGGLIRDISSLLKKSRHAVHMGMSRHLFIPAVAMR